MELPTIRNYGEYSGNGNYGAHSLMVEVGPLWVWYSYENWIDGGDKAGRVDAETFKRLWEEQVAPLLAKPATV